MIVFGQHRLRQSLEVGTASEEELARLYFAF
jgi:hypothetical protein